MEEKRQSAFGAYVVVGAAVLMMGLTTVRERWSVSAGLTPVGSRHAMAEVAFAELGGGTWRLGDYRGQVVAINLWATWCGPCVEETPSLVRAVRDFSGQGFAAVGVSLDEGDRERKVSEFARRFGVSYPMAFPDALSQMRAGLEGIPTTLLIDREGRVAKTYVGEVRETVLRADVSALLKER